MAKLMYQYTNEGNLFVTQKVIFKLLFILPMYECSKLGANSNELENHIKRGVFYFMSWLTMFLPLHMVVLVAKTVYDMDKSNLVVLTAYAIEAVWFMFSFVGMVYFNLRRKRLEHILEYANTNFKWRSARGKTYVEMSQSYALAKWVAITWTSVTAAAVCYSVVDPLLRGTQKLSVDCWYPVDKENNFNFAIIFLLQMWAKLVMVGSFSSGSSLYVTLIVYCCSQYDGLFCSLKNIFYTSGLFSTLCARVEDMNDEHVAEYFCSTERKDDYVEQGSSSHNNNNINNISQNHYNNNNNTLAASLSIRQLRMAYNGRLIAALDRDRDRTPLFGNNNEQHNKVTKLQQKEMVVGNFGCSFVDDGFAVNAVKTDVSCSSVNAAMTATSRSYDDNEISDIAYIKDFRAALRSCVDQQNSIVHVCNLMEDFFNFFAFLRLSEMTLQLCFLAFVIAFTDVPTSSYLTLLIFFLFTIIDLYFLTYPAEYLRHQSLSVGEALMRAPWQLMMRYFKNDFLIMLTFAARPVKLTALRIFILNADRLRVVVGTAFSYFTLLSSFN